MSRQSWTPELKRAVGRLERNKDGLVKVVSAMEYLKDVRDERSEILNDAGFTLVQERRNLRFQFCDELKRQDGWKRSSQ